MGWTPELGEHSRRQATRSRAYTELQADRCMHRAKGKKKENQRKKEKKKAVKRLMKRLLQPRKLNNSSSCSAFSFLLLYLSLAEDDCSLHPFLPFRG